MRVGTIGACKFGWKKKLQDNIMPKLKTHTENARSESFLRSDDDPFLNLQELINTGTRFCCICSRSRAHMGHQDISTTLCFWVNAPKASAPAGSCLLHGDASPLLESVCSLNSYLPLIITACFDP